MALDELLSENIIELLGLEALSEQEKKSLIDKMTDLVMKRVLLQIMDRMKAEDSIELTQMERNPQEILAFVAEKVPDVDDLLKQEIVKVKEEMLQAVGQI